MDLVGMTERECEVFLAGMLSGYLEGEAVGYARGRPRHRNRSESSQRGRSSDPPDASTGS